MMDIVVSETLRITTIMNYKLFAFASFYSRIVLKKLSSVQLKAFRKVERFNKGYLKSLADIKWIKLLEGFAVGGSALQPPLGLRPKPRFGSVCMNTFPAL